MSKSRLEKFLYALYSLDSSDLPNTLSRIEELYKCLVTGDEAPTFKPLSRVEKYLMAILGAYDVENLPNPLSRVEVLLHKLAVGDDNLDDFKSFISEHEELLAEIIRNGGVGGNIDIEYVLYTLSTKHNTLYNTAEKPVKSAILKGSTLVNHKNDNVVISPELSNCYDYTLSGCKSNANYLIKFSAEHHEDVMVGFLIDTSAWSTTELKWAKPGNITVIINSGSTPNYLRIRAKSCENLMIIEYQDGMENWDIPYFEGMQSVKMPVLKTTGKNLLNPNWKSNTWHPFKLKSGTKLTLSTKDSVPSKGGNIRLMATDGTDVWMGIDDGATERKITLQKDVYKLSNMLIGDIEYQLEIGDNTPYEPFKSNILTVNEDVVLRGIGNVQDTLDLMTGELTERIGEVVLDGSETIIEWQNTNVIDGIKAFSLRNCADNNTTDVNSLSDTYITYRSSGKLNMANGEGVSITSNHCYLKILTSKLETSDIDGLKKYLSQNPITVQYELAEESVKTVDLSVVNQDGNDTKLSTFNDITYVTLSSEELIPEAELEVATKNEEVLNTMSLEMDDISTTQNDLQETLDTQSENVDSTMIATTEIYEGLL